MHTNASSHPAPNRTTQPEQLRPHLPPPSSAHLPPPSSPALTPTASSPSSPGRHAHLPPPLSPRHLPPPSRPRPPPPSPSPLHGSRRRCQIWRAVRRPPDGRRLFSTGGNGKKEGGRELTGGDWPPASLGRLLPLGSGRGRERAASVSCVSTSVAWSCLFPRRVASWMDVDNLHARIHVPLETFFCPPSCIFDIHARLEEPLEML